MVRRNSRRRPNPRRRRQARPANRVLARQVARLSTREPFLQKCAPDPPPFRPGITITKTVHLRVHIAAAAAKSYGTPTEMGVFSVVAATQDYKFSKEDVEKLLTAQCFSTATGNLTLFEFYAVRKICVWGTAHSTATQRRVTACLLAPGTAAEGEGKGGPGTWYSYPSPVYSDEGTAITRPHVAISSPVVSWWGVNSGDRDVENVAIVTASDGLSSGDKCYICFTVTACSGRKNEN